MLAKVLPLILFRKRLRRQLLKSQKFLLGIGNSENLHLCAFFAGLGAES
jgi:hypothetical protein